MWDPFIFVWKTSLQVCLHIILVMVLEHGIVVVGCLTCAEVQNYYIDLNTKMTLTFSVSLDLKDDQGWNQ